MPTWHHTEPPAAVEDGESDPELVEQTNEQEDN